MKATQEMLDAIKLAVKHMGESWDAERDFELEVGREFDELDEYIRDLAVCGAESVDLEMVQAYLDEFYETAHPFKMGPFGGTKATAKCDALYEEDGGDNGKK